MQGLADEFPKYAKMVSIGVSAEGRDIWALNVTNSAHRHPHAKDDEEGEPEGDDDDDEGEVHHRVKKGKGRHGKGKKGKKYPHKLGFVISGTLHAREVCPARL